MLLTVLLLLLSDWFRRKHDTRHDIRIRIPYSYIYIDMDCGTNTIASRGSKTHTRDSIVAIVGWRWRPPLRSVCVCARVFVSDALMIGRTVEMSKNYFESVVVWLTEVRRPVLVYLQTNFNFLPALRINLNVKKIGASNRFDLTVSKNEAIIRFNVWIVRFRGKKCIETRFAWSTNERLNEFLSYFFFSIFISFHTFSAAQWI